MTWPKTVGKTVDDYVEDANANLDKGMFDVELRGYLKAHRVRVVDSGTIDTLFEITAEFLRNRFAVAAMKQARITQDWSQRKRLIKSLNCHLSHALQRAERSVRKEGTPLTSLLGRSVLGKADALLRELKLVAQFQKLQESQFIALQQSAKTTRAYVWELGAYLERKFPRLAQGERDLIIAGTMIAARIKSDEPDQNVPENIPMARSRANRSTRGEDNVVSWLREVESAPHLPKPRKLAQRGRE